MRALVLAAVSCVALVVASGCKKQEGATELTSAEQPASPPVKVQTAAVGEQPMPEYLTLTGTLRSSEESDVAADASGKVTATYVERGQKVKRGDLLAVLDARSAALTASAAVAQTNLAQAQLDQAKKECDRVDALFKSGAISQAEYDRTKSQCQTTQWSAAAAQAQQRLSQKIVGDAYIRAPFDGTIGERFVNVGQYVQPSTKVVSLYAPDPLRLELTVPEANVGALKQDMPVTFTVSSYGDQAFHGAVKFISPNVRPSTRDLVVEALCPNPDGKLRPGMFAVAKLEIGQNKHAVVPKSAVKTDETQAAHVFVVADRKIQDHVVQLGGDKGDLVAVLVGVKPGEKVVVDPSADVHDGATVQ